MLIVLIVYSLSFIMFKVYKSLWKYIGVDELIRLSLSCGLATAFLMICTSYFLNSGEYVSIVFMAGVLSLLFMVATRTVYRILRRIEVADHATNKKYIIIGAGDAGNLLLKEINQNQLLDYKIVGFVDDVKHDIMIGGHKIIGTTNELSQLKEQYDLK